MKFNWPRFLAGVLVATAAALVVPATARADLGTGGISGAGGTIGTLVAGDVFIGVQGEQGANLTDLDLLTYFNQANCQCERTTWVFAALNSSGAAKRSTFTAAGKIDFWVGVSCDNVTVRTQQCDFLKGTLLTQFAAQGGLSIETTAKDLNKPHGTNGVQGTTTTTGTGGTTGDDAGAGGTGGTVVVGSGDPCSPITQVSTLTIYGLIDFDGDSTYDLAVTKQVPIDMTPPPASGSITTAGGNQAVVVNWSTVDTTTDASGILGYQILCARAGMFPVFQTGAYKPEFETAATNCPGKPVAMTMTGPDQIDPAFVCSERLSASATSARIKVLENDIYYGFRVLTIDKHRNASSTAVKFEHPAPSFDFYNIYRNDTPSSMGQTPDPGRDTGGYCAVPPAATAMRGRDWLALPAIGAALAAMVLARRRRRP